MLQSWDAFFRNASNGAGPGQAHCQVPAAGTPLAVTTSGLPSQISQKVLQDHQTMQALIRSYQVCDETCKTILDVGLGSKSKQ